MKYFKNRSLLIISSIIFIYSFIWNITKKSNDYLYYKHNNSFEFIFIVGILSLIYIFIFLVNFIKTNNGNIIQSVKLNHQVENKTIPIDFLNSFSKRKKGVLLIGVFIILFFVLHNKNKSSNSYDVTNNSTQFSNEKCIDMSSYNLGYEIAKDQQGLVADCNYLFDIAKTQRDNINKYCFCMGVEDFKLNK